MMLLIDMNLSPDWVPFMASRGIDAVHWSSIGDPSADDAVLVDYALANSCIIITQDLDFGAILAACGFGEPSVIQIRSPRPTPERAGSVVVRALRQLSEELRTGALVTVDADRIRISMLPLGRGR
jgi:predicted nuclease of predicted toxin-antitoxin system